MTEEYNRGPPPQVGTNWWDMPSSRTSGGATTVAIATSSSSSSSNLTSGYVGGGGGGWLHGISGDGTAGTSGIDVSLGSRATSSSMDNNNNSSAVDYHHHHNHPDGGSQVQVTGLGLSCHHQSMDWNHQTALLDTKGGGGGGEIGGFRSMLQEGMAATTNPTNFNPNETSGMLFGSQMGQWKPSSNLSYSSERSLFPPAMPPPPPPNNNTPPGGGDHFIKSRGFSPSSDQLGLSCSRIVENSPATTFLDSSSSSSVYDSSPNNNNSPSTILQGLIINPNHPQQQSSSSFGYQHQENYNDSTSLMANSNWMPSPTSNNNKVMMIPQLLRSPGSDGNKHNNNQQQLLHFTNNGPFWNSTDSSGGGGGDMVRPPGGLFFPTSLMQTQMGNSPTTPTFEDQKPKFLQPNSMGGGGVSSRDPITTTTSSTASQKKTSTSQSTRSSSATPATTTGMKRSRGETTMPPFKVRKEKMGDRITALQQLVSPFGKTDTASVLSEAIEYIKFLHEQVSLLSTPYLKSGTTSSLQQHQQQMGDNSDDLPEGGPRRDLRSRGLCLVPVSSTFPVAHETSVDFWTPTFGGTFR